MSEERDRCREEVYEEYLDYGCDEWEAEIAADQY
jgi:hypothetical protein